MDTKPKQYEILPDESYAFKVEQLEEGAFSKRGAAESAECVPAAVRCGEPARKRCLISSSSFGMT
jgi:hypothetical protein